MEQSYVGYEAWKGWGAEQFMILSDAQRAYYAQEFRDLPVRRERVLEIGFGSGALLAWFKEQGAEVFGTELSSQGVVLAHQHGVKVLQPDLADVEELAGSFSVIAAFDVLEHLSHHDIAALFDKVATILRPGGHFIARFPNGGSPFGRSIQHGDVTHISTLTVSKISQLVTGKPLTIVRAGDAAVSLHGGLAVSMAKRGRNLLRRVFERLLRALYGIEGPLYPNLTVVFRRH